MSGKRKRSVNKTESQPMFRFDENGKVIALPFKFWEGREAPGCKDGDNVTSNAKKRKFIPIDKINPTPYFFEDSPFNVKTKGPIVDNKLIRKELFKMPENRKAINKKPENTIVRKTNFSKLTAPKNVPSGTSTTEMEKSEKMLRNKSPGFIPTITHPPLTNTKPIKLNPLPDPPKRTPLKTYECKLETLKEVKTPGSKDSELSESEFLAFEKQFKSPLTDVCNLLQKTKLQIKSESLNVKEEIKLITDNWSERLNAIKQQNNEDLRKMIDLHNQRFDELQKQQSQDIVLINKLLERESENVTNKENRRSGRLAAIKNAVSPAAAKGVDLRKSTLQKNLPRNIEGETPRLKKAVDMYNNLRGNCSILCTPKMSRADINSPKSTTKSLSRRIQQQCLLLQDTPR